MTWVDIHVRPAGHGWQVTCPAHATMTVETRALAVQHARQLARQLRPSQLIVHTSDDRIDQQTTYPARGGPRVRHPTDS